MFHHKFYRSILDFLKHYEDLPEPIIQTTCQQLIITQRFLIKDNVIRYVLWVNIKSFSSQISFNSDSWYLSVASRSLGDLVLRFSIFPAYMYLSMSLTVSMSRSSMSIFFSWLSVILWTNMALNTGDLAPRITLWQANSTPSHFIVTSLNVPVSNKLL